jgi:hypothetical protein
MLYNPDINNPHGTAHSGMRWVVSVTPGYFTAGETGPGTDYVGPEPVPAFEINATEKMRLHSRQGQGQGPRIIFKLILRKVWGGQRHSLSG